MRELVHYPQATFGYEMMSGALVWSDELPEFRVVGLVHGWGVIRFVLRFRTTLTLGEPDEELREYWDEAQRLFPEWPGFDPERRSPGLREVLRSMEANANAELDEFERQMDKEGSDQPAIG